MPCPVIVYTNMKGFTALGTNITQQIENKIENYCKYHWKDYKEADDTPFGITDFRNDYIMHIIRDAYGIQAEKRSLRSYRDDDTDDARMRDSRTMAYIQHYRNLQSNEVKDLVGYTPEELEPDDVKSIEGKLKGHKINAMQNFEKETISNLPIIKAIVSKRICDVKKISNETFTQYMNEYDALVRRLLDGLDGDDESYVFSTIALFTLEWKYDIELLYRCAIEAERRGTTDIPVEKIVWLCGNLPIPTEPDDDGYINIVHTESRFILNRIKLISYMYANSPWEPIAQKFRHYLLMNYYFNHELVRRNETFVDYYAMVSTHENWAEFLKNNYNLKDLYQPKEWTTKRIRYVRKLYDCLIKNMPTPKS